MSTNNNKAGFTHEKVETSNFLLIVLTFLVVAVGGLVEIVRCLPEIDHRADCWG